MNEQKKIIAKVLADCSGWQKKLTTVHPGFMKIPRPPFVECDDEKNLHNLQLGRLQNEL
jgi:hypothetical protein